MAVTSREVSASATGVALESLRRFVASRFLRVDAPAAAEGIAVISKSVPLCTFEAAVAGLANTCLHVLAAAASSSLLLRTAAAESLGHIVGVTFGRGIGEDDILFEQYIIEFLKYYFVLGFFCCVRSCRSYNHPDRIIFYTIYVRKIINTNINTKLNTTLNIGIFGITYKKYNDHPRRDITSIWYPTVRVIKRFVWSTP